MSEISELKEAIVSLTGEMNQRFNDIDRRFDAMDKRFDVLENRFDALEQRFDRFENNVMNEFRDMAGLIGQMYNETCARFDKIEQRLDKIESDMKIRWITPDLAIRLEAVEKTVAKHSEQLAKLTS